MKHHYQTLTHWSAAWEVARLAITAFGDQVGQRSAEGCGKTRLSIARLGVSVDITRLPVPPRPPKRQSKGCLFFCQSILAKTVITPDFLRKNRESGVFCVLWAILIYLQLLLSASNISLNNSFVYASDATVAKAWAVKYEQAYEKAELLSHDDLQIDSILQRHKKHI